MVDVTAPVPEPMRDLRNEAGKNSRVMRGASFSSSYIYSKVRQARQHRHREITMRI